MNPNLSSGTRTSQANGSSKQQAHQPAEKTAEKRPAALTIGDKVYFAGTTTTACGSTSATASSDRVRELEPEALGLLQMANVEH